MLNQKMNLSGQAIYAPKKVYLSKSLSDSPQTPGGEEKTGEPADDQPITDNMFEIQSQEFLSLFGQPNAIPKKFCTSSSGSGQYIFNNSTGHGHFDYPPMDKETDQQQLPNYLPSPASSFPGLFSSVIKSNGPSLPSSSNTSIQHQHSFVTNSSDTSFLPYAHYSKELDGQMHSPNTGQVSVIMSQMTSVNGEDKLSSVLNTAPVPSVISSQVFSVNATDSSCVNTDQSSSTVASQSSSMNANQFLPVNASQTSSMNGSQVPSALNISHAFSVNPSQTSVNNKQLSAVNVSQTSFVTNASCLVQNSSVDSYSACQFLSVPEDSDSGEVLPSSGVINMETETTRNNERLETLKNSNYIEQQLVCSSMNVSQTSFTTTSSIGQCDSTQSPIGLINSPESWTFSPLVPFSLSHDSYDECSSPTSPFPVRPEITSESTLDLLQSGVRTPVSASKDTSVNENLISTVENSTYTTMTWAQRYGININARLQKLSSQSFKRVSLADIEEFSVKSSAGKQTSVVQSSNKSFGPTQPKKQFESTVGENSSKNQVVCSNSSSVISSSQVSSTNMNQELSPQESDQGQNKMLTELFPMPSSTSDVSTVKPKMFKADEEESNKISSTGSTGICVQASSCEDFCQVCGDKAAGFYCGAFICEACKKFFMRASKLEKVKYICLRVQKCVITKESRVQCQYCRFQKCLSLKMYCPGDSKKKVKKIGEIPCRVCSAPSSGFHFGALTCEGCKGFFRRMAKERECQRYKCSKNGSCDVNSVTRNLCKACRYRKCLECGMSIEGSRIGRQPNSIKHAISIEAEKQGKHLWKEQAFSEKININDMTAIPATAEELAEINTNIQQEQLDLKNTEIDIKTQQVTVPGKSDIDVTPLLIGPKEIKQEPRSPIAKSVSPLPSTSCEKTLEILNKCADCNEELEHLLPLNTDSEEDELKGYLSAKATWTRMMSSFEHTARTLIKFSKKVPGFRALSLDDQIKLVQGSIYPIVVLNCSRSFDYETKQYSYFNFSPRQRETIHSFFPMLKILSSHFIHTGIMVKLMNLSTMEYTFLSILLLLNADVENLDDSESVRKLQMDTTFALQYHEETNYPDGMTRFGMLLVRLAELHFILMQHNTAITVMLKQNPELTLPQMYKEMFGEKVLEY